MDPRRLLVGAIIMASIGAVTADIQRTGRNVEPSGVAYAQTTTPTRAIQEVWQVPVLQGFDSASFSPDNAYVVIVGNPKGHVTLRKVSNPLRAIWSTLVKPGVTNAVVGPHGDSVVAYALMDPTRQTVTVIRNKTASSPQAPGLKLTSVIANSSAAAGPEVHSYPLDGAVWGATISADGKYAAVVTGGHSLYLFALDGNSPPTHMNLMGTGNSIAISRDASFVASGTWDDSGVACYDINGNQIWQYKDRPNRVFEAQIAAHSPYVLGLSFDNAQQSDATLYVWSKNGTGSPISTHALGPDDSEPQTLISGDGTRVALSYVHRINHGDRFLKVRELVMLDQAGTVKWTKGGALMSPNLVAISENGDTVTVRDDGQTLYNFDVNGKISTSYKLGAPIVDTATSADGTCILVHTSDGFLTLLRPV